MPLRSKTAPYLYSHSRMSWKSGISNWSSLRTAPCGPMEGFWGHLEARALLWQAVHQQARTRPDDWELYPLLQHQTGSTQFRCLDTAGKTPAISGCIKSGQQPTGYRPEKLYIFLLSSWRGAVHSRDIPPFVVSSPFHGLRVVPCKLT